MTAFFFKKMKTYERDMVGREESSESAVGCCLETVFNSQDHLHLGLKDIT